jgi:hypothetical protein
VNGEFRRPQPDDWHFHNANPLGQPSLRTGDDPLHRLTTIEPEKQTALPTRDLQRFSGSSDFQPTNQPTITR